jgi:hypothetical protein
MRLRVLAAHQKASWDASTLVNLLRSTVSSSPLQFKNLSLRKPIYDIQICINQSQMLI